MNIITLFPLYKHFHKCLLQLRHKVHEVNAYSKGHIHPSVHYIPKTTE